MLLLIENSISSNYGIGTYLRNIAEATAETSWDIFQIEFKANDNTDSFFCIKNYLPCYSFPLLNNNRTGGGEDFDRAYQLGVFYYVASRLGTGKKIICHANAYGYGYITDLFREHFGSKIVFTVHYMDWAFRLYGNRDELQRILNHGATSREDVYVRRSFDKEKRFLTDCCDQVIAIAQHSYDTLRQVYKLPGYKLSLIYNSVQALPNSTLNKTSLREKYGFSQTDIIILFVGRIDYGKGIFELVSAFKNAYDNMPRLRLIIAGDGAYSSLYKHIKPMWNKITLTGYVDKNTLNELYNLSDLGLVPSLHEEFGYVAVEMASAGLPTIVNPKGGLKEIASKMEGVSVLNTETGHSLTEAILNLITSVSTENTRDRKCNGGEFAVDKLGLVMLYRNLLSQ